MIVNHNIPAITSLYMNKKNETKAQKSLTKLSSGLKIESAADDAAGLAISEKMKARICGLSQASRNAQDGISLLQTADGGLSEIGSILQRMRKLTVQACNGTLSDIDRTANDKEVAFLAFEINDVSQNTKFNGHKMLFEEENINFQIGTDDGQIMNINLCSADTVSLGLFGVRTWNVERAQWSLPKLDSAIELVSDYRARFGAYENRLEKVVIGLNNEEENLQSAESLITDADMAKEMTSYVKQTILMQSSQAMLAQANSAPQQMLPLLQSR